MRVGAGVRGRRTVPGTTASAFREERLDFFFFFFPFDSFEFFLLLLLEWELQDEEFERKEEDDS
jgi:hypothetical protein